MSEHRTHRPTPEHIPTPHLNNAEHTPHPESPASSETPVWEKLDTEAARRSVETHARTTDSYTQPAETGTQAPQQIYGVQQELRTESYKRGLRTIRNHLPLPAKAFSNLVHNPVVDALSTATAASISRPFGLLWGASAMLVGSAVLLYSARHYGFHYNFVAPFILFAIGYFFSSVYEALLALTRKHKS